MDTKTILSLLKQRLGIMSNIRDEYLEARVRASIHSLASERGVMLNEDDTSLIMFIVDYTAWQYKNVEDKGAMPLDLRARLNNIIVKNAGGEL